MAKLLLLTLLLVGIAILLLGIRVFFTRDKSFPSSHVSAQPKLREKGLSCHRAQHREAQTRKGLYDRLEEEQKV